MKLFLAFAFTVLAVLPQTQTNIQESADLVVVKFSCGKYGTGGGMIRSVQDPDPPMNEPITINRIPRNEPQEVKNASTKVVKSFSWEYQLSDKPDSLDRQFYCSIKAKPSESKDLELFSPLAPSRVVDASKAGQKPAKSSDAKVIINKIEYTDGSVWQRQGWNPKTFADDAIQKVAAGKCIGL